MRTKNTLKLNLPTNQLYDEKQLLSRVANGDEEAFTLIFKKYQQKIYALAYHLTESFVYAEEIVQDVFLKIWLRQAQLPAIDNFEAYLFIVARNHIYSYLKGIAKREIVNTELDINIPKEETTPENLFFYKEYDRLLEEAVRKLPGQQYEVYCLSKIEGYSRDEVAEKLKISPGTVKVHLARAMRSIRGFLLGRMPYTLVGVIVRMLEYHFQ